MTEVTLGDRTYDLQPQRIGRIGRKLKEISAAASAYEAAGSVDDVTGPVYEALKVFIPDLDPEWKLAGYPSAEAYEQVQGHRAAVAEAQRLHLEENDSLDGFEPPVFTDPYDEAADRSPTLPQVMDAIDAIFEVQGGQRLVRLLKNVVGPEAIRAILRTELLRWANARSAASSDPSPS